MSLAPYEEKFLKNLDQLAENMQEIISELAEMGYRVPDPQLIFIGRKFIKKFDKSVIIKGFLDKYYRYQSLIFVAFILKDRAVLIEHSDLLFSEIPKWVVDKFSGLLADRDSQTNEYLIEDEDQVLIWNFVYSFIKAGLQWLEAGGEYEPIDPVTEKKLREPEFNKLETKLDQGKLDRLEELIQKLDSQTQQDIKVEPYSVEKDLERWARYKPQ